MSQRILESAFAVLSFSKTNHLVVETNGTSTGAVGLVKKNGDIVDVSFDILSLEALFLVPRYGRLFSVGTWKGRRTDRETNSICSLVSLNSYFGSLVSQAPGQWENPRSLTCLG